MAIYLLLNLLHELHVKLVRQSAYKTHLTNQASQDDFLTAELW